MAAQCPIQLDHIQRVEQRVVQPLRTAGELFPRRTVPRAAVSGPCAVPHVECGQAVWGTGLAPAQCPSAACGPRERPRWQSTGSTQHPWCPAAHLYPDRLVPAHAAHEVLKLLALAQAVGVELGLVGDLLLRRLEVLLLQLLGLAQNLLRSNLPRGPCSGGSACARPATRLQTCAAVTHINYTHWKCLLRECIALLASSRHSASRPGRH